MSFIWNLYRMHIVLPLKSGPHFFQYLTVTIEGEHCHRELAVKNFFFFPSHFYKQKLEIRMYGRTKWFSISSHCGLPAVWVAWELYKYAGTIHSLQYHVSAFSKAPSLRAGKWLRLHCYWSALCPEGCWFMCNAKDHINPMGNICFRYSIGRCLG